MTDLIAFTVAGLLDNVRIGNMSFPEGNVFELLQEDVKKALEKELVRNGSLEGDIAKILSAGREFGGNFTRERVTWPKELVDYTKDKYFGAFGHLVPENKRVFEIKEGTNKVPFTWKEVGIDRQVRDEK